MILWLSVSPSFWLFMATSGCMFTWCHMVSCLFLPNWVLWTVYNSPLKNSTSCLQKSIGSYWRISWCKLYIFIFITDTSNTTGSDQFYDSSARSADTAIWTGCRTLFFFFLTPLRDGSLVCYWANGPEQYFEVVENAISRSQILSSHCVCLSLRVGGKRCNNLSFTSYV